MCSLPRMGLKAWEPLELSSATFPSKGEEGLLLGGGCFYINSRNVGAETDATPCLDLAEVCLGILDFYKQLQKAVKPRTSIPTFGD